MPVYKDKKRGTWYYDFRKVVNGITYRHKKRGFSTKAEASLEESKIQDQLDNPKFYNSKLTIDEVFYQYFIIYKKTKLKPTTLDLRIRTYENHIKPILGSKQVSLLNAKDLTKWKQYLLSLNASEVFTNQVISLLRDFINYSLQHSYITNNNLLLELERVHLNKIVEERQVWDMNQLKTFLDSFVLDDPREYEYYLYFYALAYSGMRPNEFRALKVKDIQGDYLVVNKSITSKLKGSGDVLQTPKNNNSVRKVIMPHNLIELLLNHVKGYNPNDYIFGKEKAFRETNLRRMLDKHIEVCGLPHIVIYGFRHSHATNLIKAGVPIKVVSKRLGHKDASTTMNFYWHLFSDDEKQVLEVLK